MVYGPPGVEARKVLVDRFQEAFPGIQVEYWGVARGGELAARVLSERRAGRFAADVFIFGATTLWGSLKPAGALDPIGDQLVLPDFKNAKLWKGLEYADVEERYILTLQQDIGNVLTVNTRLVDLKSLTSYWDLLDSRWAGKIVVADPRRVGQAQFALAALYHFLGAQFLERFSTHKPAVTADVSQLAEWVARGRYAVGISAGHTVIKPYVDAGLPILGVSLREAAYTSPGYWSVAIANRRPHPAAAKLYVNWLFTKEVQLAISVAAGKTSVRTDVPRAHLEGLAQIPEDVPIFGPHLEKNRDITEQMQDLFAKYFGG